MAELTLLEAAARVRTADTLGLPLGPGHQQAPRVMATAAAPPDAGGWRSLWLHSGGAVEELRRAGADPDRVLLVEVPPRYPRTRGHGEYRHALHVDEIDVPVGSEDGPTALPNAPPSELDESTARHTAAFIPEVIGRNARMVTINGAMAVDVHGQVVADTRDGDQCSGIGGAEDFIAGPGFSLSQRSLICMPSTVVTGGQVRSRIVPWFEAGAVITTPRQQVDVVITEHGAAELEGKTVHQRGQALAAIAAPEFRDGLPAAAARASKGRPARRPTAS